MVLFIEIHLLSCRLTNYCFSSSSDVVTMSLQMSPVNAHSENQPPFYYQPAVLLPEAAARTSSHQVEPFLCQHLECSSTEQVPLPTLSLVQHECHYQYFLGENGVNMDTGHIRQRP